MKSNQTWEKILQARSRHNIAKEAFLWLRRCELEVVLADILGSKDKVSTALEIGAGIPIQAALLSPRFETIYTLDLPQPTTIFSESACRTKDFLKAADINNVIPLLGNAEKIPLKENSVDLIYSFSVLEHIVNLDSCIDEMYRVLKPGGVCVHIVPSSIAAIVNLAQYYLRLRPAIEIIKALKNGRLSNWAQIKASVLPQAHGERFHSFREQFAKSSAGNWANLFTKRRFNYIKTSSCRYFFCELLPTLEMNSWVFKKTLPLAKSLGQRRPFKYMGSHLCLTFKKNARAKT